jgi:predicted kinase
MRRSTGENAPVGTTSPSPSRDTGSEGPPRREKIMTILRTTIGLPGSGKTTDAAAWVNEDPEHRARNNRDDLRDMLHGGYLGTRFQEEQVTSFRDGGIIRLLRAGISVVADDTNLRWGHVVHLQRIASRVRVDFEIVSYLNIPIDTCVERDRKREHPVTEKVITNMWVNSLRNQVETWRTSIVRELELRSHADIPSEIARAVSDPLAASSFTVVQLARRYTDAKIREFTRSDT